jgi:putative membrane protein
MRTTILVAALAGAGASVFTAPATAMPLIRLATSEAQTLEREPAKASETTSDYVRDAALGDRFEIEAAKLARERTHNPEVQRYARMMIEDHTASSSALKAALIEHHIDVAPPKKLDQQHAQALQDLQAESSRSFDERYMEAQVQAHEEALELHNTYAQNGDNPDLKRFAALTASKVRKHLQLARAIVTRLEYRTANVH